MKETNKWYHLTGEDGDVVVSTRVRLARNLANFPFPDRLGPEERRQVCEMVRDALFIGGAGLKEEYDYLEPDRLNPVQVQSLVERHLISPEFAEGAQGRALLLRKDESVSIMLCEEDHVRIQVMRAGFALKEAYELADRLDTLLDSQLHFAFDARLGYLTQCPTNLGTGMRASFMLHLPALEATSGIQPLAKAVSKIGLTIRGTYGEGTKPKGALYQISNQITLGISEQNALENLSSITRQVMEKEHTLAGQLDHDRLEDSVYRAWGLLQNARILGSEEFMELISRVRLGVSMGMLKHPSIEALNALVVDMQPASLIQYHEAAADASQRDKLRARLVRECLSS